MELYMWARIGILIQALLSISILYLGFTIYSFTNTVSTIINSYPQLLSDLNQTTSTLKIEKWLELAEKFEALTPHALITVDEIRGTIEKVNQTVVSIDKKIPQILDEIKIVRTQAVPDTLSELKNYRIDVIPIITTESKAYRETIIPNILLESKQLRQELPVVITKIDDVMDKSKQLSQQAAEGAVKGVLLSPIQLIRDAGTEIKSQVQQ